MKKSKFLPIYHISYVAYFNVCFIFSWSIIHRETYTGEIKHVNDLWHWEKEKLKSLPHCTMVSIISIAKFDDIKSK